MQSDLSFFQCVFSHLFKSGNAPPSLYVWTLTFVKMLVMIMLCQAIQSILLTELQNMEKGVIISPIFLGYIKKYPSWVNMIFIWIKITEEHSILRDMKILKFCFFGNERKSNNFSNKLHFVFIIKPTVFKTIWQLENI